MYLSRSFSVCLPCFPFYPRSFLSGRLVVWCLWLSSLLYFVSRVFSTLHWYQFDAKDTTERIRKTIIKYHQKLLPRNFSFARILHNYARGRFPPTLWQHSATAELSLASQTSDKCNTTERSRSGRRRGLSAILHPRSGFKVPPLVSQRGFRKSLACSVRYRKFRAGQELPLFF